MSENNYSTVWANGDNIQAMWNKIKTMFLSAAHDQTSMADSWRTQARNNLGLGRNTLISDLYAGRAQNDDKGNVITDTYAASMSFRTASGTTYLSIYNNAYSGTTPSPSPLSSIPINASNGLARLDVNAKIPLALIPDSIAGQLLYGGTVGATGVVALSQNAKDKWGITSLTITSTNYSDYDGVYFIASADFDTTRNAYIYYDSSYTGDKTVRMGDWVVATTLGWVKIDNTDAVRSVSGCKDSLISPTPGITGDVIITAQRVGALDLYLPNETQEVQGKVQFDKDIWSLNGIAAYGIADLSIYGAASSGTITQIQIDGTAIQDVNGVVNLPAYPTWATLSGKPELATVATSGSYNDLTDKPNIPQGTVTSVGLTVPTGLSVSPSSITTSGTFAISLASGYIIPKTEVFDTLTAAIGNLQSSLGSAAYRDDSYFATAEEYGVSCNDITTLQSYFSSGSAKTAVKLLNPRSINGTNFDGSADITTAKWGTARTITIKDNDATNSQANSSIDGSADFILKLPSTIKATLTGNASTATKLATPRDLNIASSDGTGASTAVSFDGSASKTLLLPATIKASLNGNADTATKLATPRSIWGQSFDGSASISGAMTGVTTIDSFVSFDGTNSILSVTGKITASGDIKSTSGNIEALAGGVAAFGIADLAIGAGGGAGTLTQIQINGTALTDVNGVVNITLAQGDNNGQIKIGGQNVSVHGLGSFAYISSLALSSLTGASEVNKIETLASTGTPSGFLKRASNGNWSFDTTAYLPLSGGTMSNTNLVTNLNADLLDGKHNGELTALNMTQESKPNQEFTYRKSPKTIDTDSMRLDRIKGKTLVWNQNANNSYSSEATYTLNGSTSQQTIRIVSSPVRTGHRFYSCFFAKASAAVTGGFSFTDDLGSKSGVSLSTAYSRVSMVSTITRSSNESVSVGVKFTPTTSSSAVVTTKCFMFVDLTLMFGAGNEPNTSQFEAWYDKYYSYNKGQLINNSAKAIESVGFNLWDEEWELGSLDYQTGLPSTSTTIIRSKSFISVVPNSSIYIKAPTDSIILCAYDVSRNPIGFYNTGATWSFGGGIWADNRVIAIPSNVCYLKIRCGTAYGTSYNNNICVNISDTSKNGTYEPYKKTITDLNLQEIRVKSPNIWDEEWELGTYNSDGTKQDTTNRIRSKNLIKVVAGGKYYMVSQTPFTLYEYDANGTFVQRQNSGGTWTSHEYTLNDRTAYIAITSYDANITTYNNNICINLSDSAFNGRYFPHGVITFNGLKSAGSVYDEISSDGRRLIRRVGDVDLGTMNWNYDTSTFQDVPRFQSSSVVGDASTSNANTNILSTRHRGGTAPVYGNSTDRCIVLWSRYIYISDHAYTTAASFKTAMSGVYAYYELAAYETYDLVDPIPTSLPSGTTERRLPEDTADSVIAPFSADITYGTNNGDILASATPWEMIHGRPTIDKGHGTDGAWFCVNIGGQKLYIRFNTKASTETNGPGFELEISDSPDPNQQTADYTKSFTFGTLSSNDIDTICV